MLCKVWRKSYGTSTAHLSSCHFPLAFLQLSAKIFIYSHLKDNFTHTSLYHVSSRTTSCSVRMLIIIELALTIKKNSRNYERIPLFLLSTCTTLSPHISKLKYIYKYLHYRSYRWDIVRKMRWFEISIKVWFCNTDLHYALEFVL